MVRKLFKSKKGFNDMVIIGICTLILLFSSVAVTQANAAFGTNAEEFDSDNLKDNLQEESDSINQLSAFGILISFLKLGLWDVGNSLNLPFWLDIFFTFIFIVLVLTIARNLWIGGGA